MEYVEVWKDVTDVEHHIDVLHRDYQSPSDK